MEHDTCDLLYLPLVTTLEHVVKISQQFFIQNRCVEMGCGSESHQIKAFIADAWRHWSSDTELSIVSRKG